jgi:hypothetical protein
MSSKALDYVKGKAIVDLGFRQTLLSNPEDIASQFGIDKADIRNLLTTFGSQEMIAMSSLAEERLDESARYQKAL